MIQPPPGCAANRAGEGWQPLRWMVRRIEPTRPPKRSGYIPQVDTEASTSARGRYEPGRPTRDLRGGRWESAASGVTRGTGASGPGACASRPFSRGPVGGEAPSRLSSADESVTSLGVAAVGTSYSSMGFHSPLRGLLSPMRRRTRETGTEVPKAPGCGAALASEQRLVVVRRTSLPRLQLRATNRARPPFSESVQRRGWWRRTQAEACDWHHRPPWGL